MAQCVSDFAVDNKSKQSIWDVTTCMGDEREKEQIFYITSMSWFHKNCLPGEVGDQPQDIDFKYTTSLSVRNQS